jgi:GT2 family glycosyltransferase
MLSFIVPAHDEEALIVGTLRSIRAAGDAAGAAFEIVVVDDASSDRTAALAAAEGARVVRVECRQIGAARNAGARAATGDVFVFVDADTRIAADVVTGLLGAVASGAVGGGAAIRFDEPVPAWVRAVMPLFTGLARWLRFTGGCFLFCRRADFEAVGGFDETLYAAEELELCRAVGRRGRFVILRAAVLTSGRKLRTYSAWELLGTAARIGRAGRAGVRDRSRLGVWYDPRRPDREGR